MRRHAFSPRIISVLLLLPMAACKKPESADAYGNFEAEEVAVSSEIPGQLRELRAEEGTRLEIGAVVARIDTVTLALDRDQLVAQRAGLIARQDETVGQIRALEVQHEIARRTRARIERLFAGEAATATQRDQVERDERVLAVQISASRAALERSKADVGALEARINSMVDRLRRTTVTNPVRGTVLVSYARVGEIVGAGQPLYRIANLDTLTLRVYVTGSQLSAFRLGSRVTVHVSGTADSLRASSGVVTWVSARAEFTPTPVQTREDRGDLVYAVKIRVPNTEGMLKVGMPADVSLSGGAAASAPGRTAP